MPGSIPWLHCFKVHPSSMHSVLFLFMAEYYSVVWTDHVLFLRSSVDGHLGSLHLLAIMNDPQPTSP